MLMLEQMTAQLVASSLILYLEKNGIIIKIIFDKLITNIYLQCYLWDQQHQEFQQLQEDHGVQGSQEHQQYQRHPVDCSRESVQCMCWLREIQINLTADF